MERKEVKPEFIFICPECRKKTTFREVWRETVEYEVFTDANGVISFDRVDEEANDFICSVCSLCDAEFSERAEDFLIKVVEDVAFVSDYWKGKLETLKELLKKNEVKVSTIVVKENC